jgi:nitrite reductase/ring-hydroxylating ferredoxin subunit
MSWESAWEPTGIASAAVSSRALVRLRSGRLVALVRGGPGALMFALDAHCYHHGGPLADGDIEDFGGSLCVSCPWHHYKITLGRGEALYVALDMASGAREVKSKGVRQRAHGVREDGAGLLWVADTGAGRPVGAERDGDDAVRAGLGAAAGELWLAMERAAAATASKKLPSDAYVNQKNNSLRFSAPGEAALGEGCGGGGDGGCGRAPGAPPLHSSWGAR